MSIDADRIKSMGAELVAAPLVSQENPFRHESGRLAKALMETLYDDHNFRLQRGLIKSYWDWQTYKHRKELDM